MKRNISNSEKILENHISGINRVVKLDIVVNGNLIKHFKHFRLQQSAKTHHSFELTLAHDSLDEIQNHNLEQAQQFFGKRLTVTFKYKDAENESPERTFVGVVTKVAFSQDKMSLGNIVLKGHSPTILMDSAPHTQSFGGTQAVNTSIIADNIIKETLGTSKFDFRIDTQNKSYINYSAQYCETHYNYLTRIAEAYGEQFYYDGEILHFGKLPPNEKPIQLIYGSNVNDVQVELKAVHTKPEYFGYNSSSHAKMLGTNDSIKHLGDLSAKSYELNDSIFKTRSLTPTPLNPNIFLDVDDAQKSARGSAAVEVFTVSGNTSVPFLYIGCVTDLAMRKQDSNETSHFTTLMITEVTHEVDARGYYTGNFEAIAEGTGFMPKSDFILPKAEPQIATVISNIDPLNQGRIQVQFDWQLNDTTHFIRMMSPDAGGTDAISQNRGFVAVPEIGDQVMVGFEYNNPDFPFAMGGMFHGKVGLGGGADNHLKSIQTRSGIKVLMNDANGSVTIQDPSGNIYFMDGGGNINVTAPNKITMNATDVEINANNNFDINVINNMTSTVGNTALMNYLQKTLVNTPIMLQTVSEFFHTQAGKALINSENEIKIEAKETNVAGFKKLHIHSNESAVVNSKGTVEVKGEEGTSNTNVAEERPPSSTTDIGECIVEFRPRTPNYGKFGFDFMRIGDNTGGGVHDITYLGNMGTHAQNDYNAAFTAETSPYNKFKGLITTEYNPTAISVTEFKKTDIRERYATPWLSLYRVPEGRLLVDGTSDPEAGTCIAATLKLLIEVKIEPDELRLEFDDRYFTITGGGATTKAEAAKPNSSYFSIPSKSVTVTGGTAGTPHTMDIEINCIKEIPVIASIKAFAITKDATTNITTETLAGKLLIKANNKANRKTKKIVLVNVKTSLAPSGGNITGQEDVLKHALRQALIDPRIKTFELDLTAETSFNNYLHTLPLSAGSALGTPPSKVIKGYYLYDYANRRENTHKPRSWKDLWKYLNEKLHRAKPEYTNYIKVYYLGSTGGNIKIDGIFEALSGYSQPGEKTTILFNGYDTNATTAHEVLHAMGLDHTFESKNIIPSGMSRTNAPNGKYTFRYAVTDNILDYSHRVGITRKSLMEWQWEIIRDTSQPEP
ncbi:type VI secretion system Vgr family protein [Chryseobacterium glaciei]|uniref:type VI secretion system Vgr family protein n=1 Tax=Chryseobacterium glaciei TaxID=1685010 RepID=UPI0008314846|nr:phage baseplate assembly protein V [Chryseobacterium glaciei]